MEFSPTSRLIILIENQMCIVLRKTHITAGLKPVEGVTDRVAKGSTVSGASQAVTTRTQVIVGDQFTCLRPIFLNVTLCDDEELQLIDYIIEGRRNLQTLKPGPWRPLAYVLGGPSEIKQRLPLGVPVFSVDESGFDIPPELANSSGCQYRQLTVSGLPAGSSYSLQ
eukprot:scaffold47909_cov47-Prasinocladus_malaysianus.AAC.2